MDFSDAERGQAIQVGAVLLFAILIIAFSTYQAVIIPADNRRVEFNHNQEVQTQLAELRNAILATATDAGARSVTVPLGTQYPSRTLGLNPNSPGGSLRTVGTTDPRVSLSIANATATGETGDLWNGSALSYNTGGLEYRPIYNQYDAAPRTVYDNSVLYNRFSESTSLVLANQTVVDGTRLSLVTLNGSLARTASTATTVDVRPVSSSSETILIEDDGGDPITLTFTSRLSADRWRSILSDEPNVVAVSGTSSPAGGEYTDVRVELRTDVEYQLRMTKAAVGQGATEEGPAYLTDVAGNDTSVRQGTTQSLTLAVRDRYNNPVAGASVNGSVRGSAAGSLESATGTTGADGRVTFTYNASGASTGTHTVAFSTDDASVLGGSSFEAGTTDNVSMQVRVTAAGGGGGNGSGAYAVEWTNPAAESANGGAALSSCDAESCTWDVGASGDDTLVLNATLDPAFEGIDLEFALDNTTVGSLSPTSNSTADDGAATTTLTGDENGTVQVLASGNEGSDTIEIVVEGITSGGIEYVNGSGSAARAGSESRVDFDIRNTGSGPITITGIRIESSSGSLASVYETNGGSGAGQHEVYIDASDPGVLEVFGGNGYQLGTDATLDDDATLAPGEQAQVTVLDFRNNGGQTVSAADEPLTITLYRQNGQSTTFTFTPPGY